MEGLTGMRIEKKDGERWAAAQRCLMSSESPLWPRQLPGSSDLPLARWHPMILLLGRGLVLHACVCACVKVPKGGRFIYSEKRSSDMPVEIHLHVCAHSHFCVCVLSAYKWGENTEGLGWAALSRVIWKVTRSLLDGTLQNFPAVTARQDDPGGGGGENWHIISVSSNVHI